MQTVSGGTGNIGPCGKYSCKEIRERARVEEIVKTHDSRKGWTEKLKRARDKKEETERGVIGVADYSMTE